MRIDYIEKLKMLKIMDDDFARIIFEDRNVGLEVLKILNVISKEDQIIHYETQRDEKNINARSLVFDIFVITNSSAIDLEIENKKNRASPLRARFHSSEMDAQMLQPRQDFQQLPMNIVVFVCSFDYYQKGLPYYTIEREVNDLGIKFEDKSKIIYVNGEYSRDDEIGKLVHDLRCTNPDDMYNEILREKVRYYKETERGQKTMYKIWDDIRNEGIQEGIKKGEEKGFQKGEKIGLQKGVLISLKGLMTKYNLGLEEAIEVICIPEEEKEWVRKALEPSA